MSDFFRLNSTADELASFRPILQRLLAKSGLGEKKTGEVTLAVDETLSNIMRHGYPDGIAGKVEIEYKDYPERIEISIRDFGKYFDPNQLPDPELPSTKPGGLGVYFMKQLMDKVERDPGVCEGNRIWLVKYKGE